MDFDFPKVYDAKIAGAGRWFEVYRGDHYFGSFLLPLIDSSSASHQGWVTRYRKMNPREKDEAAILREMLVHYMLDWKDIKADGKDVPFTKASARAYFNHEGARFVVSELISQATTTEFFEGKEDEKNV